MSVTGLQIRQYIYGKYEEVLGFLGKATALASGTDHVTDVTRFNADMIPSHQYVGWWIRITSTSNSDRGFVAMVTRVDPNLGKVFFSPAAGAAIVSGATYSLTPFRPDEWDRARDRALTERLSPWQVKPLSVLKEVSDWRSAAYSSTLGGSTNATPVATTLDFPNEWFRSSMVVTNSGADGIVSSESYYVQPTQTYRVFGRVSVRAQTASVRVRRITATAADITLSTTSTFTLRGWQWFDILFTVPDGCSEIQVWLGGASASCISEWAGIGLMSVHESEYSLESRVISPHDVAHFYAFNLPTNAVNGRVNRGLISGARRVPVGDGVLAVFDEPPTYPVYYAERHRYAALQTDYMALADRTAGDDATTDCDLRYAAAATIVELLEPRVAKLNEDQAAALGRAKRDLLAWDRRVGADPLTVSESKHQGSIPIMSL